MPSLMSSLLRLFVNKHKSEVIFVHQNLIYLMYMQNQAVSLDLAIAQSKVWTRTKNDFTF